MSCWTCERCGQKWCDLDECPMCGAFEPTEYWDNPHAHELINRREPKHYEHNETN